MLIAHKNNFQKKSKKKFENLKDIKALILKKYRNIYNIRR
jgi:hypothetical protein